MSYVRALALLSCVFLVGPVLAQGKWTKLAAFPEPAEELLGASAGGKDRKSTRLNSSHTVISYAVFCLKKKKMRQKHSCREQVLPINRLWSVYNCVFSHS